MGTNLNQKKAAQEFADWWKGKGYEKGESQTFWNSLLHKVFGIEDYEKVLSFENRVKLNKTSFIDAYILPTRVLIEQKSIDIDLRKPIPQGDGSKLTPFEQAKRYNNELKYSEKARWIVVCNFREFHIYDMETLNPHPEVVKLEDLPKEYHRLQFLVNPTATHIKKEEQVSLKAGEIVGVLYDRILREYKNPDNPESQKSLNKLCVRLVFCLYAEDAGIFGTKNMFHDYMDKFPASEFRSKLIELFRVLDTRYEDRDDYMDESLAAFPYVNGGLFSGDIEIPRINDEIRALILQRASDDFDWSEISPTIFGAVFESTLNPETRHSGGMHYTSVENIHKVIDPLFLDDLKAELATIKSTAAAKPRRDKALAFQNKLAGLKFFDPACGSGNFLTESYTSLRRLENEALRIVCGDNRFIFDPIKVSINQFYGIEINDFACSVAQTALWIAESQMLQETDELVDFELDPLPLKTYTNIHEGNALRMDWNEVVPAAELNYIMGNPPFLGGMMQTREQKEDMLYVFDNIKGIGELDYVTSWYKKSADYMAGTNIEASFVSTNSICQGEQVAILWKHLMNSGLHINFAYPTFIWDNESNSKAHVHVVIVGFSYLSKKNKYIFYDEQMVSASHINGYLADAPDVYIENKSKPLCTDVPYMAFGNMPRDGGGFILSEEEKVRLENAEPLAKQWIHEYIGAEEFIKNKRRYCLWLVNASPADIRHCPTVMKRIESVREMRLNSKAASTRKLAKTPTLFAQITQEVGNPFILVPSVSSSRRTYVPMGFMGPNVVASNLVFVIGNAGLYHLGVLTSSIHNAWIRTICGRLKSDYRYSKDIVYNNFPWPTVSPKQKEKIEQTAQAILDARALYPDCSLADLYDDTVMPIELRKAHQANDAAVMEAYGFAKNLTETEIVTRLFQLYQKLT